MGKIFLISTYFEEKFKLKSIRDESNSYSLGLAYLHSVIKEAGYNIITKDYNTANDKLSFEDIKSNLINFNPDYLLMQLFTMNRVSSFKIFKLARELNKDIKIIIGGVHATIMYVQLLKKFDIDYVVLGEGEETIVELLNTLNKKKDINNVKGIAYKVNGNIVKNKDRELNKNLDKLLFPKHELFIKPKRKMACILTSRGCPFKCSFCCLHSISKRIYRTRSVMNIVDEIEHIKDKFGNIKVIQIADDTFTLDRQRVIDLCREIIKRNIKVKFTCSARIKLASLEMFEAMEEAGFTDIGFGLETGSRKLLNSIHKNITPEDAIETFKALRNIKGITPNLYLMTGFPGENISTVNETIDLLKELYKIKPFKQGGISRLWVYPNTEVYELLKVKGAINDEYWLTDGIVPYYTLENSDSEIERFRIKITVAYFKIKGKWYLFFKIVEGIFKKPISTVRKFLNYLLRFKIV